MAWFKKKISADQLGESLASSSFEQVLSVVERLNSFSEIAELPEEEKSDLYNELHIFLLFTTVAGVRSAVSDETIEIKILNKMHERAYEICIDIGMDITALENFDQLIHERYASYYNALQEHEGGDAMFMLGKQFVDNALGGKPLVMTMTYMPSLYVNVAAGIKKLIESYKIK